MKAFVTRRKRPLAVLSVLTVAIATAVAVSVGGAQARSQANELKGAGSTFVAPLIGAWQTKYQPAKVSPTTRSGAAAASSDREQDRRLRRQRRADDGRPVQHMRRLRPASLGSLRHGRHVQPARPSEQPAHHGADHRRASTSARSRSGTTRRSRPSTRASTCRRRDITPVYRSDSSGTTYNFTTYLNTVSKQWKSRSDAARLSTGRPASAHAVAPASRASSREPTVLSATRTSLTR